jgi:hypothetical protein
VILLSQGPTRPLYAHWPERREVCANVVCEGPSACYASAVDLNAALLNGPCVAVNRAICLSEVIPFDVWAMMDDPRPLFSQYGRHAPDGIRYFSGDDAPNILFWRDLLGAGIGRLYTRSPSYMDQLACVSPDGAAPMVPTVFHALAWLLQVGVKRVRLIGCDMEGSGSPIGPTWSKHTDEGHELRWEVERKMLELSETHYRARGARIERWQSK